MQHIHKFLPLIQYNHIILLSHLPKIFLISPPTTLLSTAFPTQPILDVQRWQCRSVRRPNKGRWRVHWSFCCCRCLGMGRPNWRHSSSHLEQQRHPFPETLNVWYIYIYLPTFGQFTGVNAQAHIPCIEHLGLFKPWSFKTLGRVGGEFKDEFHSKSIYESIGILNSQSEATFCRNYLETTWNAKCPSFF